MKKLIWLAFAIFAAQISWSQAAQGSLQVVCPEGFQFFLDGVYVGKTEKGTGGYFVDKLKQGPHSILVRKDGFVDAQTTVDIPKNGTKVLNIAPEPSGYRIERITEDTVSVKTQKGTVFLWCFPAKATVLMDGRDLGPSGFTLFDFPAGPHRVVFRLDGKALSKDIVLKDGDTLNVKANFSSNEVSAVSEMETKQAELSEKNAVENRRIDIYLITESKDRCKVVVDGKEIANIDLKASPVNGSRPTFTVRDIDYGIHSIEVINESKYYSPISQSCTVAKTSPAVVRTAWEKNPSKGIVFFVFDQMPKQRDFLRWLDRKVKCTATERNLLGKSTERIAEISALDNLKEFYLTSVTKTIWVGNSGFGPWMLSKANLALPEAKFNAALVHAFLPWAAKGVAACNTLDNPLYTDLPKELTLLEIFKNYRILFEDGTTGKKSVRSVWPSESAWVITTQSVDYYDKLSNIGKYYTAKLPFIKYPSVPVALKPGLNELHLGVALSANGEYFDMTVNDVMYR